MHVLRFSPVAGCRAFLAQEGADHANLLGLARALAFEGDWGEGEEAFIDAVTALENDADLDSSTFAGIDWDYGWAAYEVFRSMPESHLPAFFSRLPRTQTFSDILNRGIDLFFRYHPKGFEERKQLLKSIFTARYLEPEAAKRERDVMEEYVESLLSAAGDTADPDIRAHFESLAREVQTKLEK